MIDLNVSFGTISASPTGVPITAIFPGQTTAWTATAIRMTVCAKGSVIVCEQPMKFRLPLPTPYTVRAGHPAVFKIALKAANFGDWAFAEDAIVVVGPVTPPPVVTPPPPAPTPSGTTASGTTMPTATSLTGADGSVWTMVPPDPKCEGGTLMAMQRNGVSVGSGQAMRICDGIVWGQGDGATWYQGTPSSSCGGAGWINARGTPPC